MRKYTNLISALLEVEEPDEEEGFDFKELEPVPGEEEAGRATVKRHGRFKIVDLPNYMFLISYLTPVAYYDKIFKTYYRTLKHWSPSTEQHICHWQKMISETPAWKDNPENWEKSEFNPEGHYVRYPRFKQLRQKRISTLFRQLMPTMVMKSHEKRRLYHVDPKMRQGSNIRKAWLSGHLKHHDTGKEGLPRPGDYDYEDFFADFDPHEPEDWDWGSDLRNTEPHERGEPDEE